MIYFVIPNLIEQPTWGGDYINQTKGLGLKDKKIGQAYEFTKTSQVVDAATVSGLKPDKLPYFIGDNSLENHKLVNKVKGIKSLEEIDLKATFGKRRIPNILIKFTQAKGNSYQIHPRTKGKKYLPKAESWYFFEPGKVTVGIKPEISLDLYQDTCERVYKKTKEVSKKVQSGELDLDSAKRELRRFIELNNPENFVNVREVKEGEIVENTVGGVHHSWEEDPHTLPDGNILYEVQQDVLDKVSTIRAFDKGKLLDDGDYRKLDIKNYFDLITKNHIHNNPENLIKEKIKLKDLKNWKLNKIFQNNNYQMDDLIIVGKDYKVDGLRFRHMFIKSGQGQIIYDGEKITLHKGFSYLIPDSLEEVFIKNTAKKDKEGEREPLNILMTYHPDQKFWDENL